MNNKLIGTENNIVFYEDENNNTKIEVRLQGEDVWLNVNAIANLFNVGRPAITKHINNIYNDQELNENGTCSILEHMGLTNWKNSPDGLIYKYDVAIAKNYLNESELKKFNNLTNLFLDYAEDMVEEEKVMTMQNWIDTTDKLLKFRDKKILLNSGKISPEVAKKKLKLNMKNLELSKIRNIFLRWMKCIKNT